MNWKVCGGKWPWINLRSYLRTCFVGLWGEKKKGTWKLNVRPPEQDTSMLTTWFQYLVHLIFLDLISLISVEVYKLRTSSLCNFIYPLVLSLLDLNIILTLNLSFSQRVSYQVSHPHKTTDKIIDLHIIISTFLDSRWKGNRFSTEQWQAVPHCNLL
jgi:hypothetical protein